MHEDLMHSTESEYYQELKESIKKEGIKEPLVMVIGLYDGKAWLKNGHHRLRIAEETGIENVPICFIVRADTGNRGKKLGAI